MNVAEQHDRRRFAVAYRDQEAAAMVADRLVDDLGVSRRTVGIDRPADRTAIGEQSPGDDPAVPTLPSSGWVWLPAGFVVGFVLVLLLVLVVTGGDADLGTAILVGAVGGLAGGAIGAVFGRARADLVPGTGRGTTTTTVLSVPTDALADRDQLVGILADGPVVSIWEIDPRSGSPRQLDPPASGRAGP
ncbi:hypothetical protein [Dermatobacter hominis]|uniref:hypothetical protein n=1 Tax=Dermatobacter hominis TaxID=2884263 RepID=UPI001D10AA59|nr:hypothetical protein [Dermatobacter hominis]UDY37509.1 hypothetical protein LH044_08205 [Dermatobacter hominis]